MGYIWKIGRHKVQPNKMNPFYISLEASHDTTRILQYMYITYITYIKENFNLFACFETDFKPASQYCNDSVTHEWENTTQFAQYLCEKDRDHET